MPLTPAEMEAAASFTIMFILVGAAVFAAVGGAAFWLLDRRSSSVSDEPAPIVMSRSEMDAAPSPRPSLQTDGPQTPDRPMMERPTPAQMLDIFRVLRAAGVKREALAPAWRAAGLPLDTNVWALAAPPPSITPAITPIAGRPYDPRAYADDPALAYEEPPR